MSTDVFQKARASITAGLIETELSAPGAYWQDGEYWTLNPLRDDTRVGSFSISEAGHWYDFAAAEAGDTEKGDLIDLIARRDNIGKKDAARYIIERSGGTVDDTYQGGSPRTASGTTSSSRKQKAPPVVPVPSERLKDLNLLASADYITRKHGRPTAGWKYHTKEGAVAFAVVRYDKQTEGKEGEGGGTEGGGAEKSVLPFYWDGSRWRQGQAYSDGRPLYALHELEADSEKPVLVVEGEKCADAGRKALSGRYVVTTWAGGGKAVSKTDWSPLAKRDVTIWPDADAPGMQAAETIQNRLPHARVLDIKDRPKGWDIADAVAAGEDPERIIKETASFTHAPAVSGSAPPAADDEPRSVAPGDAGPFVALGYSEAAHFYLLKAGRLLYAVPRGGVARHLLELASLGWWARQGMITDQGNVKASAAADYVIRLSESQGRYDPERIRGAGVWREPGGADGEEIVVNDGRKIVRHSGESLCYEEYESENYYVSSDARFGDLAGPISRSDEGWRLIELFKAQEFASDAMAASALGWALIAPFGGLLKWRPHIWLTGRKGSGKSFTIDNLIMPLVGPFGYKGSGKDTEAGIRRSLRTDARPVVLDEMEPRTKREEERINQKIELARNASSDASGYITIAAKDGGVDKFSIRSCFAFASVQIPSDMGAAIESRHIKCEFKTVADEHAKHERTRELIHLLDEPGRYRRRIFRMLPGILRDIEYLRQTLAPSLASQREADQIAPIMAALWAVTHDSPLVDTRHDDLLPDLLPSFQRLGEDVVEDEDRVVHHILQATVRTDEQKSRTVAELLHLHENSTDNAHAAEHLSRLGIRLMDVGVNGTAQRVLAIATQSDAISEMLRDTPYRAGYDAQLRRHAHVISRETKQVRFASGKMRARLLDWEQFRQVYMEQED